jgi:CRISPR/Cas system-associated exonuclease Cas4 (RecB family)
MTQDQVHPHTTAEAAAVIPEVPAIPAVAAAGASKELVISDSKVNSYVRCAKAFEYRYVHGLKMAPSWAITGRSAHAAEEANYRQKQDSFVDMSLNDVRDIAAEEFDKVLHSPTDEIIWDKEETIGGAKDRTVRGVTVYHTKIAPKVQPIMVEERVELTLPWGTKFTGQMDVVDQATNIRDTKHVSYSPRDGDDWYGTQPGLYGWAYEQMTGVIPKFAYDYIILGRKNAKTPQADSLTLETSLTPERITLALDRVRGVETLIRTGSAPANPSQFNCSGCGYRVICPYSAAKK